MARTFTSDLSVKGLRNLQKQLREYKNQTLPNNVAYFASELARVGIQIATIASRSNAFGSHIAFTKEIEPTKYNYQARAIIIGANTVPMFSTYYSYDESGHTVEKTVELNPIMFAEYGAGVYARFNYRGTFPDQQHAFQDSWAYATELDEEGRPTNWQVSSGVSPSMPLEKAKNEMITQINSIAMMCFQR